MYILLNLIEISPLFAKFDGNYSIKYVLNTMYNLSFYFNLSIYFIRE